MLENLVKGATSTTETVDTTEDNAIFVDVVDYDPRYDTIVMPAMEVDAPTVEVHSASSGQLSWEFTSDNGGEFLRTTYSKSFMDDFWTSIGISQKERFNLKSSLTNGMQSIEDQGRYAVSYTHLTLPTKRIV